MRHQRQTRDAFLPYKDLFPIELSFPTTLHHFTSPLASWELFPVEWISILHVSSSTSINMLNRADFEDLATTYKRNNAELFAMMNEPDEPPEPEDDGLEDTSGDDENPSDVDDNGNCKDLIVPDETFSEEETKKTKKSMKKTRNKKRRSSKGHQIQKRRSKKSTFENDKIPKSTRIRKQREDTQDDDDERLPEKYASKQAVATDDDDSDAVGRRLLTAGRRHRNKGKDKEDNRDGSIERESVRPSARYRLDNPEAPSTFKIRRKDGTTTWARNHETKEDDQVEKQTVAARKKLNATSPTKRKSQMVVSDAEDSETVEEAPPVPKKHRTEEATRHEDRTSDDVPHIDDERIQLEMKQKEKTVDGIRRQVRTFFVGLC